LPNLKEMCVNRLTAYGEHARWTGDMEDRMTGTDPGSVNPNLVNRFAQVAGRGRTLIIVVATEVVLFVIANVTYGNGNDKHGAMRTVSNAVWAIFLVGFVVMIVLGIFALVQVTLRRVAKRRV
jgi:hypothetical protein